MFRRLFAKRSASEKPSAPRAPEQMRIYVVGDIHGRLDLLKNLATRIAADATSAKVPEIGTIFLGDYVDRGPNSAEVLDFLSDGSFPTPVVALRGNHEEIILRFLEDENVLDSWRKFGGLETLHSYGVPVAEAMRGGGYKAAQEAFKKAIPNRHIDFLNQTLLSTSLGDYFFCHAGVRPGTPLQAQVSADLLWIREEFLRHQGSHGKVIVHGHTPVQVPEIHPNRINIDTGAYASANLTALVLEGEQQRFLSTSRK